MSLATKLTKPITTPKHEAPPWAGPQSDAANGGCTQSLLGKYAACRERFRVKVIDGWGPSEKFEPALEFGNLHHAAEESFAGRTNDNNPVEKAFVTGDWQGAVRDYATKLLQKYPFQQDQVQHWYSMCLAQFPAYVDWWSRHPDMGRRTPLFAEQVFHVPYRLPSGRTVWLRGKWDSVDLVESTEGSGIFIQENKTKSGIDAQKIGRMLSFDIQTMTYVIVLRTVAEVDGGGTFGGRRIDLDPQQIKGVRYNVIRRSAHKTPDSMLKKITEDVAAGRGGEWFARWNVEITAEDVTKFKREFLDNALENLCDDYEWWTWCQSPQPFCDPRVLTSHIKDAVENPPSQFDGEQRRRLFPNHINRHYRLPYGIYNPLLEGGVGETDAYLATGSTVGLTRITSLFPELEDAV